ncbi:MAG: L-serine ammonia-lyase, iron-sulfur-dependent, subunit alpha [Bacteroidales bacterium]|nr:L-serine ammonia-lyase, iron-sulfur-dependent, subunit alpha [Bacteroidales bacterium]
MVKSIFNNVLGPVMIGPSSSHTAASVRIGRLVRSLLNEEPLHVRVRFAPSGSLASTYRGQGSAMGLAAGLLGLEMTDRRVADSEKTAIERGLTIEYTIAGPEADHPNTYFIESKGVSGKEISLTALSTGGGVIRLVSLNGREVTDDTEYVNMVMPFPVRSSVSLPFTNHHEAYKLLSGGGASVSALAENYELAACNVDIEKIKGAALDVYRVMTESEHRGRSGTSYSDRILPGQSHLIEEGLRDARVPDAGLINDIIVSVTSVMECKSSMGVIVAAPTAGSCGVLAGTLAAIVRRFDYSSVMVEEGMMAAGLTGLMIDMGAGFAGEEGGCQYECGSASAMTAAALASLSGGSSEIIMAAASMALQNMLGLICDPVADRVEVPCLGKNISASLNAVASANMALGGFRQVIPFPEVIDAMLEVATSLDRRYRCTCLGGLSVTPAAKQIEKKLQFPGD